LLNLIHDQHIKIPNPDTKLEKKLDKDPIGRHWKPPKFDPTPDELLQGIYESLLQMQHKVFPRREFPRLRTMPNFTAALLRDPDLIPISSPRGISNNATPNREKTNPNLPCEKKTSPELSLPILNWDLDDELKITPRKEDQHTAYIAYNHWPPKSKTNRSTNSPFSPWKPWNSRLQLSPLLGCAKTYI
jgi:hypothetical protein